MTNNPGDMFGDLFGNNPFAPGYRPPAPQKKQPEKGPNGGWRAKVIDGEHYVPMSQVADMLENNNILPGMKKRLRDHISAYKARREQEEHKASLKTAGVETGLCNGIPGQFHPWCIVGDKKHPEHFVEVERK